MHASVQLLRPDVTHQMSWPESTREYDGIVRQSIVTCFAAEMVICLDEDLCDAGCRRGLQR